MEAEHELQVENAADRQSMEPDQGVPISALVFRGGGAAACSSCGCGPYPVAHAPSMPSFEPHEPQHDRVQDSVDEEDGDVGEEREEVVAAVLVPRVGGKPRRTQIIPLCCDWLLLCPAHRGLPLNARQTLGYQFHLGRLELPRPPRIHRPSQHVLCIGSREACRVGVEVPAGEQVEAVLGRPRHVLLKGGQQPLRGPVVRRELPPLVGQRRAPAARAAPQEDLAEDLCDEHGNQQRRERRGGSGNEVAGICKPTCREQSAFVERLWEVGGASRRPSFADCIFDKTCHR
mmetsp:Transcript_63571/g.160442  ORF Transcript_63571/g.160442 Transcript_63571/m.160442 type:complete len:288 (+) Transcript_63571:695-1558(+)